MSEVAVLLHRDAPGHVFVVMRSVLAVMEYIKLVDMLERPEKWTWKSLDRNTYVCNGYIIKRCPYYEDMWFYKQAAWGEHE